MLLSLQVVFLNFAFVRPQGTVGDFINRNEELMCQYIYIHQDLKIFSRLMTGVLHVDKIKCKKSHNVENRKLHEHLTLVLR